MNNPADGKGIAPGDGVDTKTYRKKDFWSGKSAEYVQPHYRLEKCARMINRLTQGKECTLLDVGCGPAAMMHLLAPNVQYYGIDIAIPDPAPNLFEADLLETPIRFGDKRFDIVLAQGFFEYVGDFQSQKFAEIAQLLNEHGTFIVTYTNFGHRDKGTYWLYNNVQPLDDFRGSLTRYFKVEKIIPTSHNWKRTEPNRRLIKAVNMPVNVEIPFISPMLAPQYFFVCSPR